MESRIASSESSARIVIYDMSEMFLTTDSALCHGNDTGRRCIYLPRGVDYGSEALSARCAIVGSLGCDGHIVGMALGDTGIGDAGEFGIVQGIDVARSAISHA